MYGMVNEGIRSFIIENFGETKWQNISQIAKVDPGGFILMQTYPDKVTYDIVGSICQVLGISAEEALEAYGRYWIGFAAGSGYENLLLMFGTNFRTSLNNLNHMHEYMGSFMSGILAPSFNVVEETEEYLEVIYSSTRPGLVPFVKGLLYGLLDRYKEKGEVTYLGASGDGHRFKIIFA